MAAVLQSGRLATSFALTWRNDLNGWCTGNFDRREPACWSSRIFDTPNNPPNGWLAVGSVAAEPNPYATTPGPC